MPHITSAWATSYGLPDPASTAAEIDSASPDIATRAARVLNGVMLAARFGVAPVNAALAAVRAGWSASQPGNSIRTLLTTADAVEEHCGTLSRACTDFAESILHARTGVRTAYQAADEIIASWARTSSLWSDGIDEMLRIERERSALVWNLHVTMRAIARTLDAEAATVCARLAADPASVVPRGGSSAAGARHQSNVAKLRADLRDSSGRQEQFASAITVALTKAEANGFTAQLLSYDSLFPVGQGGVAIAIGDVSRASSIAVLVPGVGNSPTEIANSFGLAHTLNVAADKIAAPGSRTATIVWLDYDVPLTWGSDGPMGAWTGSISRAVTDSARAVDASGASFGGDALASFVRGLRPVINAASNITLIGHSYGAATVSQAAHTLQKEDRVSDVVLVAAPGAGYGISSADDYQAVDADHVYALSFERDPIPGIGQSSLIAGLNPIGQNIRKKVLGSDPGPFGPDPADLTFGANVIDTPSNTPPEGKLDFDQHALSNYLSGASLAGIAAVTAGKYSRVPVRGPKF